MPILDVTLLSGRTAATKTKFIQEVTEATVRTLDVKPEAVRVIIREVDPSDFAVAGVTKAEEAKG